jgi:hypothetical protein
MAARRIGMQDRSELAGIQMTPPAFRLVIVERAQRRAFRTGPLYPRIVRQVNIHLALLQVQLDPVHLPWLPNP